MYNRQPDHLREDTAFESESEVAHSCPLPPHGLQPAPGFSLHGIFQARVLEWVAITFSRGSSWPRDRTQVSWIEPRSSTLQAVALPFEPFGTCFMKHSWNYWPNKSWRMSGFYFIFLLHLKAHVGSQSPHQELNLGLCSGILTTGSPGKFLNGFLKMDFPLDKGPSNNAYFPECSKCSI